ncbi:hypothetical protein [Blastococcus sp. PRF04-17]|uniref:hypothetical protein n=1 Tax=Blastococcus sp. PRF04-17 TaxID=2933797 RepID=UPI001FF2D037|nr:hypothetical protein [Blastococcus sp. PRF04-17]UOY03442.1 hypothetical protein MVA48_08975 [Blastococcus sp. PRF04-17]
MPSPAVPARPAVPPPPGSLVNGLAHPVALVRWFWLAYMTPGRPGRVTTETELRWIYTAWLGAFLLKMFGSTWDVSWHFRWLRDDLAPPHLLNSAGTALVVGLVIFHSYTGYGVDRRALRLMQWGIGLFLIAVPIDIVNHRINGLDITSWSPSHALLYFGTAVMLAGAIRGWWLYAAPGRVRDLVSLGLWLFFVENAIFPNQHQEYGVLSLAAYDAGRTTAEVELLDFAREQGQTPEMFMLPVPSWVHPAWLICAGLLSLVVARKLVGYRWTATIIAATYLAYRAVMWLALVGMGFPPSVLPLALLAGAVLIDLTVTWRVPGWLAGVLVTAGVYGAGAGLDAFDYLPRGTGGRHCRSRSASACSGWPSTCSPAAGGWHCGALPTSRPRTGPPRPSDGLPARRVGSPHRMT